MSFMLWATGVFFVSSHMTYRALNVRTESSVLIAPPPLFSSKSEIIRTPHCLEGVVCCLQGERDVMFPAPRDRTRVSPSLRIFIRGSGFTACGLALLPLLVQFVSSSRFLYVALRLFRISTGPIFFRSCSFCWVLAPSSFRSPT